MTNFTKEFFISNREKLRTLFKGTAPIVLTANGVLQRNSDNTFQFRQDSSFWFLTGLDDPDIVLVMDKEREYIILPTRSSSNKIFDGYPLEDEVTKISGVKSVLDEVEGWKLLGNRLKRAKHVAIFSPAPSYVSIYAFYANPARKNLLTKIRKYNMDITPLDLRPHIIKMRSIKQPMELEAIESSIDLTVKTLKNIKKSLGKYQSENELDAIVWSSFRNGGGYPAYTNMVAAGKNACTIHYNKNSDFINDKDLILLDIGAEVDHYVADITRTYAKTQPSKRQSMVYKSVLEVRSFAMSLLKPGIMIKEYEEQVEHFMGEQLRELGLIQSISKDDVRKYYPHLTSHFLGLDPHDVGDYTKPIEPNMVLTVEPGIYIPEEEIGIRIEDDVLVTENGIKNLSGNLPTDLV